VDKSRERSQKEASWGACISFLPNAIEGPPDAAAEVTRALRRAIDAQLGRRFSVRMFEPPTRTLLFFLFGVAEADADDGRRDLLQERRIEPFDTVYVGQRRDQLLASA
jgi:hypothetical protein